MSVYPHPWRDGQKIEFRLPLLFRRKSWSLVKISDFGPIFGDSFGFRRSFWILVKIWANDPLGNDCVRKSCWNNAETPYSKEQIPFNYWIAKFIFGLTQLLFLFIILKSIFAGKQATSEVWEGAKGLEWTVASPAPYHTFETPPEVKWKQLLKQT